MQTLSILLLWLCWLTSISARECRTDAWKCANNRCIWESYRCNGYDNCRDGSDEQNCTECKGVGWKCGNNCIHESHSCNGTNRCDEDSDTQNCECRTGAWKCANNKCIPESHRCDGRTDRDYGNCGDGSDEQNCAECKHYAWKCGNNCIHESYSCDGTNRCDEDSDGQNCECIPGALMCPNNKCITAYDRCDGYIDCGDNSDEQNCDQWSCLADQWKCGNDRCVWLSARCDEADQCGDGSDEKGCGRVHIACPRYLRENQTHYCYCRSHNVSGSSTVTWQGQDSPWFPERLTLRNVQRADNGTQYTCVVNAGSVSEKAVYTLRVGYGPFEDHMSVGPSYVVSNGSQPVTLTCNATSVYPTPDYTWRGVTCEKQSPPNTCTFTPDPATDDLRNVTCTARSRAASNYFLYRHSLPKSASRTLELNVVYSLGKLFNETLNLTDRGVSFTLIAFPVPDTFVFSRDGRTVPSGTFSSECWQDAVSQRMVNCLIVPLAIPEQQLGLYSLTMSIGLENVDIHFNIRNKDRAVITSLTLNNKHETVTVNGDDRLILACTVSGRPLPKEISITHDNRTFNPSDVQYQSTGNGTLQAVLTLKAVTCDDIGTYTCTATNGIVGPDSKQIRLDDKCSPSKLSDDTLHLTERGVSLKLKARPVPDMFVVSHLGTTVSPAEFSYGCERSLVSQYVVNCTIVPLPSSEHQLGRYILTVSNGLGSVDISFNIREEDRAVITSLTLNNTNETVTVNGKDRVTLNLTCTVTGRPVPSDVIITHGFNPFDTGDIQYHKLMDKTLKAVLELDAVRCHDMGTYTCTSTNGIVRPDSKKILLNVQCPPRKNFHNTLIMEEGRMSFRLAAYPVPDRFVFVHLGNQTFGSGRDVSDSFTAECKQDPVTEYIVNCDVSLHQLSHNLTGHFRAVVYNELGEDYIIFKVQDKKGEPSTQLWTTVMAAVAVIVVGVFLIIGIVILKCWRKSRRTTGSIEDCSSGLYEEIPELPIDRQQQSSLINGAPVEENPVPRDLQRDVVVPIHADLPPLLVPVQDRLLPEIPDAAVVVHSINPQPPSLSETPQSALSPEMPDAGVSLPSLYPHRTPLRNPVPDSPLSAASLGAHRHPDPNPPEEIEMSVLGETRPRAMELYAQAKDTLEDDEGDFYTLLGTALLYRRKDFHLRSVLGDVEQSPDENCGEDDYYLELIPDDVPDSSQSQENCQQAVYDIPRNLARPQNDDYYLHPVPDVLPNRSQTQNSDDYLHPMSDVLPSLRPQNDDDYLLPISKVLPSLLATDDDDYLLPISDALSQYPRPSTGDNYLHPIYDVSPKRSGSFLPKSNRSRHQSDDYLHPSSDPTKPHSICQEDYCNFSGSDNFALSSSKIDSDKPIVFVNPEQPVLGSSWRLSSICEEPADLVSEDQTQLRSDAPPDTFRKNSGLPTIQTKPCDVPSDGESYLHPVRNVRTEAGRRALDPLSPSSGSGHPDKRDEQSLLPASHHADKPASNVVLTLPASSENLASAASDADQYHCPTGGRSPHGEVVVSSFIDNTDEPCVHDELHFTSFFDNPDDSSAEDEV